MPRVAMSSTIRVVVKVFDLLFFKLTNLHYTNLTLSSSQSTVIDPSDMTRLEEVLKERQVSLFFSESPTNPYLRCIDIALAAKLCREHGALSVIDSTFATPVNQSALKLGADIVIHSATKYLAGHNDVSIRYCGLNTHHSDHVGRWARRACVS